MRGDKIMLLYRDKNYLKLENWIKENTQPPVHVQIVPTNMCNIACIFCWRVWEESKTKRRHLVDRIPAKRYMEIIKEICRSPDLRPQSVTITGGGEPLLKKDLVIKMVEAIKHHEIHCEIVTNGTLLDEKLVRKLILYKLDNLCISINATSPQLADFLYGRKGSYKKVIENIETLAKWKKKLNSTLPIVGNTMVITKYNYKEIPHMVKQAAKYEITTLNVRWVSEPYCKGKAGPLTMPADKYEEFIQEVEYAKKLASSLNVNLVSDFTKDDLKRYLNLKPEEDNKKLFITNATKSKKNERLIFKLLQKEDTYRKLCDLGICTFPFYEFFIDANGYASGCGTLASAGGVQENIAEKVLEKSMKEIWYGEKLNYLRILMFLRKFPKTCEACNVINIVKGSREWAEKIQVKNF